MQSHRLGLAVETIADAANPLTLSRTPGVADLVFRCGADADRLCDPFVLYCLVVHHRLFRGYLARAQGQISRLGQFLDPIADKIMVAAVIVMLAASRERMGAAHHPGLQRYSRRGYPAARNHRFRAAGVPGAAQRVDAGQHTGKWKTTLRWSPSAR